jgi:NAD(P)-dependent dehydrogenase (short-subunit alcohol dehydrogenase family)
MPTVLVTGASRGIGRATALRLAAAGWDVRAGVRREQDGAALVAESSGGITPVQLDVTNAADIAALDERLPERVDALVNNAGIVVGGAVEAMPIGDLRQQLEVNVVAQVAVTQAVLPRLRESQGRLVFISSISGRLSSPLMGAYAASKFAIEALADALRLELRPWGIAVALVEPGQIDTDIWRTAPELLDDTLGEMSPAHRDLYARHVDGARRAIPRMQKMASPADGVARTIERALTARRPKARYATGSTARASIALGRFAPRPMRDFVVAVGTGVPRKPAS